MTAYMVELCCPKCGADGKHITLSAPDQEATT